MVLMWHAARAGIVAASFYLPPAASAATFTTLYSFTGGADGGNPQRGVVVLGGALYGVTDSGGAGHGTVFKFDPATATLTTLHRFAGSPDAAAPTTALTPVNGRLYGGSTLGGANDLGAIYVVNPKNGAERVIYSFAGGADGQYPVVDLGYFKGRLFGASVGATSNISYLISIDRDNGAASTVHRFSGKDGAEIVGNLLFVHGIFYGTTALGGAGEGGTIFSFDPASGAVTTDVYDFAGSAGQRPVGGLAYRKGALYSASLPSAPSPGGQQGEIFRLRLASGRLRTLYTFEGKQDGAWPNGAMVYYQGLFYGSTEGATVDNTSFGGSIFSIDPVTGVETTLYSFPVQFGGNAVAGGMALFNGAIYGVTYGFGTANKGSLFMLAL